ncbi:MAG: ATP-dependent DNA helicase [Candidatus Thermoplasmatota archaeon]|nr:ATP-dependent DNA helicase [Candidatus Thermoplasmatota archaeon]
MDPMDLFPYDPRPIQLDLIENINQALSDRGHVVIEAGTGSGKTVSVLAPCLAAAYDHGKRVLYLTRTNSQQKQVVEEFKRIKQSLLPAQPVITPVIEGAEDMIDQAISELNREVLSGSTIGPCSDTRGSQDLVSGSLWEGGPGSGTCVALQGRNNMCPLTSEEPEFITGTPEELSNMCSERKKNTNSRLIGKPTGGKECRYYSAFLLDDGLEVRRWSRANDPTAEELIARCLGMSICPYEVTKLMISEAVLVTAPYIFFLSPFIRRRLLEWMGCTIEDLIVIVDEAHNLASFARDLGSITLTSVTLKLALLEVERNGDHDIGGGRTIKGFIQTVMDALEGIASEFLIDEDGLVPPSSLTETMMVLFRTNSNNITSMATEMLQHGIAIQDRRKAEGKLPRSYIHTVARFYLLWNELEFERYTPLIVKGRRDGELILQAFAMDPSIVTGALKEAHASIHLSGTLSPLDEYRDTIGLPSDTPLIKLPPPFPTANRAVMYVNDLSTNHETMMKDPLVKMRYRERVMGILGSVPDRNAAVFFPSFDLLMSILGTEELEDGTSLPPGIRLDRPTFIEEKGSHQAEIMDIAERFKSSKGGVLLSVIGGRLSEGMDFPGESLEVVIIVGIPYPRPNARQRALSSYYDIKFGKGWEYTVHAPASRRLLQAIGRMIRSESERGYAIILDKRAMHFKDSIPDLQESRESIIHISEFFLGKT